MDFLENSPTAYVTESQSKGYGKRALEKLIEHLKAMGVPLLYTSCGQGEGSPEGFYRKLGFVPTGGYYDHEIELVLQLEKSI